MKLISNVGMGGRGR